MKLAEALILRADYQKRAAQLQQRLIRAAKVQEGDDPPEDPAALWVEFEEVAAGLVQLVQQINRTNSGTAFPSGGTLSDAIALRDNLTLRAEMYRSLAAGALVTQGRVTKSEVRFVSTVSVADMQGTADRLARERRELDAAIQGLNWTIDLMG